MKSAIVEDGVVVNVINGSVDGSVDIPNGDIVGIGFLWDGSNFSEPLLPAPTWDDIRAKRNRLIEKSDYTQLPDSPHSDAKKAEWVIYRQSLRDITDDFSSPDLVVWPSEPSL